MVFSDELAELAKKIRNLKDSIETEQATKNAFIMPFISNVLGYDVFDPAEVVPEFTADVGVKRGEKVDYAIFKNGKVQILMECKRIGDPLDLRFASQLFRYYSVTTARVAILTNGQEYHVYTDIDVTNKMDEKPFLVFDLLDIDRTLIPEIQKFSKESFDIESVLSAAQELKYISGVRRIIASEVKEPSDDWVRFFISHLYEGRSTQRIIDQFRPLVAKALNQYVGDQVNSRLKTALGDEAESSIAPTTRTPTAVPVAPVGDAKVADAVAAPDSEIVTTDEERDGFNIVRAIAASEVLPERIFLRDAKAYCAILLDDNNRKPIIRLNLNGKHVKFVTTFEHGKGEGVRREIQSVVDIYKVAAEPIRQTIREHESAGKSSESPQVG